MEQVKFVEESLQKNLHGPFLNALSHMTFQWTPAVIFYHSDG